VVKGPRSSSSEADTSPREFAATTPPASPMLDYSFGLQAIMEMQKSVGELNANVNRLIVDVKGHGEKLEEIRHQSSFMKGGLAASVFFITAIVAVTGWILNTKWDAVLLAVNKLSGH
jgi:hypothetical protein